MSKVPLPVGFRKRPQQRNPARMQAFEQPQRHFHWSRPRVRKLSPPVLCIWFDGRLFLSERQLEARVAVEVTVGNMVDHLPHRPTLGPVRRVELCIGKTADRHCQVRRSLSNLSDKLAPVIGTDDVRKLELSNWITKV